MKNKDTMTCPGCGRHCPMNNVKCKYGVKYFEKAALENEKKETKAQKGGLMWRLIKAAKKAKKALKKNEISEAQLLGRFTEEDRAQLSGLIAKLEAAQGN